MAYYLRVVMTLLEGKAPEGMTVKEAPLTMAGVILVMSILVIVLGIYPSPIMGISTDASEALFTGLGDYIGAVLR
jgi:NADH:ubiquinone oxidoreductase subunit 2 (subunit N)